MKLSTRSFRGMAPRMTPRMLPPEASSTAINARLLTGDLTAWKAPAFEETFANGDIVRTIFKLSDRWLSFTDDVEVARGTILGDTDYRTYITGLDVPRFTTYDLAFNATGAPPYPIVTRPLGVPGPQDIPQLALSVPDATEGGITIINPGAEEGDDTGWTQTTPDLTVYENGDIPGIVAQSGTFWFYGGTGSSGEYYQSFDTDTVGVAVGQNLTLTWWQATGAAGSQAQLGLRFFDSGVNVVGEQFAEMTAPSPANTWVQRSVTVQIPADTVTFRIVMKFLNVGGGVTDAYIDTISLNAVSIDYTSDGTDLSTWTLGPQSTQDNNYRTTVQQDIGGTQGSVFVFRSDRRTGYIYRTLGYNDAASFRVEWTGRLNFSDSYLQCGIGTNTGIGDVISVRQSRVEKRSISGYDATANGASVLAEFAGALNLGTNFFRVVIVGARNGTSQFSVTVTVTNLSTGVVLCDEASTTMRVTGDELLFRYYSGGDNSGQRGYLDDILSSTVPQAPTNSIETLLTSYVYRYVNDFGEASAPSLPSRVIQRSDGVTVTVTTDTTIPSGISAEYGITFKQIYRAATGSAGTVFRFVAEIPLAQADYVDSLDDRDLGEVLDSEDWDLPPEDLRYILALPNGIMVGASKNQLCFSVQNRPHAWPVAFRLPTDTDITGLGNIDNAVVIGTESFVYTASGNSPDSYSMSKPGAPHACQSARSFAYLLNSGVIFAGPDGLMSVRSATQVVNLTEGIFTREQWQALDPTTIVGVAHDDIYFFWNGTVSPDPGQPFVFRDTFEGAAANIQTHTPDVAPTGFEYQTVGARGLTLTGDGRAQSDDPNDGEADSAASSPPLSIPLEFPYTVNLNATAVNSVDEAVRFRLTGETSNDRIQLALFGGATTCQVRVTYDVLGNSETRLYEVPFGTGTKDISVEFTASGFSTYIDGVLQGVVTYPVTMLEVTVINLQIDSNGGQPSYANEVSIVSGEAVPGSQDDSVSGWALDTRATGNGLTRLSMHASAAAVDISNDSLHMVLDQYTDASGGPQTGFDTDGQTLYEWNASTDVLPYEWNSKLFLLPHPMALQWCRVRASEYSDIVISFFADGSLLYTKTVTDNRAFRIRVRQDYSKLTYVLEGSSEIYSVEIADDIDELE